MQTLIKLILLILPLSFVLAECQKDPEINPNDTDFMLDTISDNPGDLLNYPVIDVHQHIYSSQSFWYGGTSNTGLVSSKNYISHYEELVEAMHKNNVVLGIAGGPLYAVDYFYDSYSENNSLFWYGAEFMKMSTSSYLETILSNISSEADSGKIKAIGELTGVYQNFPPDNSSYQGLYNIADKFSLPVFIHTGIVPEDILRNWGNYSFEYANPRMLDSILVKWPDVNFNAAHFGISNHEDFNFEDDMIDMMSKYENLFVDIGATVWWDSTGNRKTSDFIIRAISEGVEDKILYGSDEMVWPDAVTVSINYVKNANFLTVIQKKKILYWNAAEYLKLTTAEVETHFGR